MADDGSTEETRQAIAQFSAANHFPIKHAWQEDRGYRLAASRNNGARMSDGDYLIYLDGDCIPRPDFVAEHRRLSEPNCFVSGNRVLLSEAFTRELVQKQTELGTGGLFQSLGYLFQKKINRILPLIRLPDCLYQRKKSPRNWKKLRGCNFGLWKKDLYRINGFDERFIGWGFEDSDFAVRMINSGCYRKSGNFSTGVLHLYHKELKIPQEGPNWERLQNAIKQHSVICEDGLSKISR